VAQDRKSGALEVLFEIWIMIRVVLILIIWLGLFIAIFLGYYTIPIILVLFITLFYPISDALFVASLRRKRKADARLDQAGTSSTDLSGQK
jgi:apolipoprotein N-acyltransferase